jgi:hypothetical protein
MPRNLLPLTPNHLGFPVWSRQLVRHNPVVDLCPFKFGALLNTIVHYIEEMGSIDPLGFWGFHKVH